MTDVIEFPTDEAKEFASFRVYSRPSTGTEWKRLPNFGEWIMDGDDAFSKPIENSNNGNPGCIVRHVSRVLLPGVGQAVINIPFGTINGVRKELGTEWDLLGNQLRIDTLVDGGDLQTDEDFRTVFWGVVEKQSDREPPGATPYDTNIGPGDNNPDSSSTPRLDAPPGTRTLVAYDLLYHLQRVRIDTHLYEPASGETPRLVYGPAGYNVSITGDRAPNKGTTEVDGVLPHSAAGDYSASYWTDIEVLESVLALAKGKITEPITVSDAHNQFTTSYGAWPVPAGEKVRGLVTAICDRSRGLGSGFLDWDGDRIGTDTPAILRILPQSSADIEIPAIADSPGSQIKETITGSVSASTSQEIVLTGDKRVDSNSFSLSDASELTFDRVETWGEKIRVLVTLSAADDSLAKGWDTGLEAELAAASDEEARQPKLDTVFRKIRLNPEWTMKTGKALDNLTPSLRCDYRLNDKGVIVRPLPAGDVDTAPDNCRLLTFLPCPDSLDPKDGAESSAAQPSGNLIRHREFLRNGDEDFSEWKASGNGYSLTSGSHDITVTPSTAEGSTRATEDFWNKLYFTFGIELPHMVKMATDRKDGPSPPRKTHTVRIPGAHLWLGHRGAIIGLASGTTPERIAVDAVPIYRDDRRMLRVRHALASAWYLTTRRELQFRLRYCCGLLETFNDDNGAQQYAQIGHCIKTLKYAGREVEINTIVSRISYDDGHTTFVTDWSDLQ